MYFYREGGFVEADVPEDVRSKISELVDTHQSIYSALSASVRALHAFGEAAIRSKQGSTPTYAGCEVERISTAGANLESILFELTEILPGWRHRAPLAEQPNLAYLDDFSKGRSFSVSLIPPCDGRSDITVIVLHDDPTMRELMDAYGKEQIQSTENTGG